jgi:hypothetical protein
MPPKNGKKGKKGKGKGKGTKKEGPPTEGEESPELVDKEMILKQEYV